MTFLDLVVTSSFLSRILGIFFILNVSFPLSIVRYHTSHLPCLGTPHLEPPWAKRATDKARQPHNGFTSGACSVLHACIDLTFKETPRSWKHHGFNMYASCSGRTTFKEAPGAPYLTPPARRHQARHLQGDQES